MENEKTEKVIEPKAEAVEAPVPQAETKTGWMPKRTFLLIVLLVVITVSLLALALLPSFKNILVTTTSKPAAVLSYAQTELSFSTPTTATPSGYKTDVLISTGENKVTAVQLEIKYDPKVLTNVDVKAGTFFATPIILLKKIDTVSGRITYVLGISLGNKAAVGIGTVATITFAPLSNQTTVKTPINFEPKTAVTAVGYAQSVLLKSTGVLFSISPTPTVTK
jgi:hypothetical protein